ncbi:MAG: enoyl-CoA hydratase/isomerase family protein [Thermomicrobiales bacterium]
MSEWASPDERIHLQVDVPLATVRIDRPEKLNAISPEMLDALRQAFRFLDQSNDVRVILLTASGTKAFSVGADINAWSTLTPIDMWRRWVRDGHAAMDQVASVRQPTIAVIDGLALGGGLELALACDMRICSDRSRFGSPEVRIATMPGWGGARRLPDLIGASRAKQMIFTGEQIDSSTALQWGLVNDVVSPEDLPERATVLAEAIAANAPIAVQLAKSVIDAKVANGPALEALGGAFAASTHDGTEGTAAFREKRPAVFKNQ